MNFFDKIPTFRRVGRFLWKWTKCIVPKVFFSLAFLATLVALFVAWENYRTGKAWKDYVAAAHARGVKLTLAELIPPPVPDDQNFAMTPLLKPLFTDPNYEAKLFEKLNFEVFDTAFQKANEYPLPDGPPWQTGKSAREFWAAYFRQVDVSATLARDEPEMAEISAAIQRPYTRFPYPNGNESGASRAYVMSLMSRYMLMLRLTKLFHLRAWFELTSGKNAAALADTLTMLRLSHSLSEFPFELSELTQVSILGSGLQMAWVGMQGQDWTDAQLAELQQEIQQFDFLRQALLVEQGERASYSNSIEWYAEQDFASREKSLRAPPFGYDQALPWRLWLDLHAPRFVFTRALLAANAYYDQYDLPAIDLAAQRIYPNRLNEGQKKFGSSYLFGDRISVIDGSLIEVVRMQTFLNEAAVACALERYRLAHGDYPGKLDQLVPQFIEKLPHDLMTGGAMGYERKSDGELVLSVTAWTHQGDDNKSVNTDFIFPTSGKWVWQYATK